MTPRPLGLTLNAAQEPLPNSMPSSPPSKRSTAPTSPSSTSSTIGIQENVVDNVVVGIPDTNAAEPDICDAVSNAKHLSMRPPPVTAPTDTDIDEISISVSNNPLPVIVLDTDRVSPPPLVAVVFDGVHVVEPSLCHMGSSGRGLGLLEATLRDHHHQQQQQQLHQNDDAWDGGGSQGTLDDNIQLDENDGDVLERGIVVNSPAFTYVYEDAALCGHAGVSGGPPPLSLSLEEAASAVAAVASPRAGSKAIRLDSSGAISWDGDGVNAAGAGDDAHAKASGSSSTQAHQSSFRLQYLGPAAALDALDMDNTVVLNIRAIDSENKVPPPPSSVSGRRNSGASNQTDESTLGAQANANNSEGSSHVLAELVKTGQSLQDPQLELESPATRARLVVKRPLLSGDDDDDFELNGPSRVPGQGGHSSANASSFLGALPFPSTHGSSASSSGSAGEQANGVGAQADMNGDSGSNDNVTTLQLDNFGTLVSPTEPAKALSLAFRTLHMRQSSLSRSATFASTNDLQTICELTPVVNDKDTDGTSPVNPTNSQAPKVDHDDTSATTTWQVQGDVMPITHTHTHQQGAKVLEQQQQQPPRRKFHPSKEPQPQEGSFETDHDLSEGLVRTRSAADRLLQEATQYAEALGERPPRHMGEISRQIIDDDYDQFASDDDEDHALLEQEPHDDEEHGDIDIDRDQYMALRDNDDDDLFVAHETSLQEVTNEVDSLKLKGAKSEQMLPVGTPESKMVEELLTATHGGHNLTKMHLDEKKNAAIKSQAKDLAPGKEEEIADLQAVDESEAVSGVPKDTGMNAATTITAVVATSADVAIVSSVPSKEILPRRSSGADSRARTRTASADSVEMWKEKNLVVDKTKSARSLSASADTKPSNETPSAAPQSSRPPLASPRSKRDNGSMRSVSHDGSAVPQTSTSVPNSSPPSKQQLSQRSAQLQHRNSHSALFGKYMLNPRPVGSDGKPSDDAGYVYQGIKFNPPEITKRGTQRGNHAQLHRKAWLEVSDKYHRYGKNLRAYYKEWERQGHPYQLFFDWLDSKGEAAGEPLPNLPECPRMQLDRDTVLYINDDDVQDSYRLTLGPVCKGELPGEVPDRRGVVLDCNDEPVSTGPDGWIFVLRDNNFYGARKVTEAVPTGASASAGGSELQRHNSGTSNATNPGGLKRLGGNASSGNAIRKRFHHSSFFAGKAVTAAGIFITDEAGRLKCMYPHSGHYRPGEAHMQRLLYYVQRLGIDLSTIQVDVQQLAHVARKEKVVLHQVLVSPAQKGGEESKQESEQTSGDLKTDNNSNPNANTNANNGKKVVKIRTKKEKCKKADSLYLRPASYVAWILTHKAKMLSKGVFGMIQNIRQVRAVSIQEALDAVDNGGFFLKSRIKRDRHSNHNHHFSDAAAARALLQQHQQQSSFKTTGNGGASASSSLIKQQGIRRQSTTDSTDPEVPVPSMSPSPTATATTSTATTTTAA